MLGTVAFRQANYPSAAESYALARADATSPYRAEAAFQLALTLARQGKSQEAQEHRQRALELDASLGRPAPAALPPAEIH